MEGHLGLGAGIGSGDGLSLRHPGVPNLLVNRVLPENDSALLLQGLAIVLVVVAGVAAAQYPQTMMMLRIKSITDLRLQTAVFDRVMRLPMRFVSQYTTGDLASRVNSISVASTAGQRRPFHVAFGCVPTIVLMVIYDSTLAIWAAMFTLVRFWVCCCSPFAIFNCKNRCWRPGRKSPISRCSLCSDWLRSRCCC